MIENIPKEARFKDQGSMPITLKTKTKKETRPALWSLRQRQCS